MPLTPLTPEQAERLEEAADLKGELVSYALSPPFWRLLRQEVKRSTSERLDEEEQLVEAVEALLFEHRYDDGTTVLDRFRTEHRRLTEAAGTGCSTGTTASARSSRWSRSRTTVLSSSCSTSSTTCATSPTPA